MNGKVNGSEVVLVIPVVNLSISGRMCYADGVKPRDLSSRCKKMESPRG
jgi:hypothetical protein